MLRRIVVFSILGLGSLGALVIAKEESSESRSGVITINPTTTPSGPAIQIEVGDRVFLVPTLTVKGKNPDHSYLITATADGKLRIPGGLFSAQLSPQQMKDVRTLEMTIYKVPHKRK